MGDRIKVSAKGRSKRDTSRERSQRHKRRSPSRADPRNPRTADPSTSFRGDGDYNYEYDRPTSSVSRESERIQPYVDDRRVRRDSQPYDARQNPTSREIGEPSSSYHKSYDTRRPSPRYHSSTRSSRDKQEERSLYQEGPREATSLTKDFEDLRIGDNYELSSSISQQSATWETSRRETSYSPGYLDTGQGGSIYTTQKADATQIAESADHVYGRVHSTSEYGYDQSPTALAHSSEFVDATPYSSTQQYLSPSQQSYAGPAASTYQTSQKNIAIVDTRQQQQSNAQSGGNPRAQQKLDSSFDVRLKDYKKFFRVGKVFMTLWSDQLGSNAEQGSFVSDVIYGERVYSKVRRFIVVRQGGDKKSATCLPITSYNGSGFAKNGIRLEEHGFIYSKREPQRVPGMCSRALRVVLAPKAPELTHPSLVHYGKVHTVEGNWKVKDIGDLDDDSRDLLLHYFRKIFVGDHLPDPGMTPRAREAELAYVGAGMGEVTMAPIDGAQLSTTSPQQHFASASPPAGYPPTATYESSGGGTGSSVYRYPAATSVSTYAANSNVGYNPQSTPDKYTYSITPSHATTPYQDSAALARRTSSYQDYEAAPSSYYSQGQATTDYYGQQVIPNTQITGRTVYQNYEPQAQQWDSTTSTGSTDKYRYSTAPSQGYATSYQDPNRQYTYQTEGTAGTAYPRQSGYDEAASTPQSPEADIDLPTFADAQQQQKSRRDSRAGGSSHRKNRRY